MSRALTALASALVAAGCATSASLPEYLHNRTDYEAFREVYPEVLDPNYLPMMTHRVELPARSPLASILRWLRLSPASEWRLVFCHWEPDDFPLRVFIEPPVFAEELLEARPFRPQPEQYVAAAEHAFQLWQRSLGDVVRFEHVAKASDADLVVRMIGEQAPVGGHDVQVLGSASLAGSCEAYAGDPEHRLEVRYRVHDLRLYVVDEHGALLPVQVERVALHEIGHALGMRGHSPIPADLMFEVARDRLAPEGLGASDLNSFVSLYALPSGTVYRDPALAVDAKLRRVLGPPRLELAPHVDARLGFEAQLPEGWTRVATDFGVVAVDGVPWDYEASVQWNVHRSDSIEDYLERFGAAHLRDSELLSRSEGEVRGQRMLSFSLATREGTLEQFSFVESGDGRVAVGIAECAAERWEEYQPWFDEVVDSLELHRANVPAGDRVYHGARERER